eukprot:8620244-Ditylum_brightwellii.AAC.1
MAGEYMHIMMVVVHTIMKLCLECKVQWDMRMARTQVLNNLISLTERTLNTSGIYQSFGPCDNGGGFQHHDMGGNSGRFNNHGR